MAEYESKYDLNNDGIIDQKDLDILMGMFAGTIPKTLQADFNNDGVIDEIDISTFMMYFGTRKPKTNLSSGAVLAIIAGLVIAGKYLFKKK